MTESTDQNDSRGLRKLRGEADYDDWAMDTFLSLGIQSSINSFVQQSMRHLLTVIEHIGQRVVLYYGLEGQRLIGSVKDNHW